MKVPALNLMSWLPANEIAVDLGTANTLVYVKGEGIVLNEPSVVAIEKATGKIKGIGLEAKRMLGRTPDGIIAVRPLKDGVIADFDVTEKMLRYFLKTIIDKHVFRVKPKVIVCVPSGITEVERRAVRDSAETAGRQAGAHGGGADGGGDRRRAAGGDARPATWSSTSAAAPPRSRSSRSPASSRDTSIRTGGDELDQAIVQFMRKNYNLLIGEPTAEADQDQDRLRRSHRRRARDGGQGPRPGLRHPEDGAGALDRDPRGDPGADPADRRRGAAGARDHPARAGQRHRRPRHRHDRRRRADPRARSPARRRKPGCPSTWTRIRSPAWCAAPAGSSTTTRNIAAFSPPEHGQRVGPPLHSPRHGAIRRCVSAFPLSRLVLAGQLGPQHRRYACGDTVLAPLVWLQARAEEGRTSRVRLSQRHRPAGLGCLRGAVPPLAPGRE